MSFDTFLVQYGLLAIFLLLLTKSVGVPIPIPADVILLATAARVAQGKFILWQAAVVVLFAMVSGGLVQFLLARGPGRDLLFRFGRYLGLTPARLDAASARVKKGGIFGMSITVLIPGVRGVALVAAGLAGLPLRIFLPGLALGSALFISIHFFLGYLGGSLLSELGKVFVLSPMLLVIAILLLLVFGLWLLAFYRQKAARKEISAAALETWHEGICPVCLALSTVGIRSTLLLEGQNVTPNNLF
jgi:membrane protein DedA with SNARE-associated domain